MRHAVRLLLAGALLLGPAAGLASAVSIRDLVKLKAAGVSDQVLIELIKSDGSVFHLTADDVLSLRRQGLSDQVIVAMLRTATARPVETSPQPAGGAPGSGAPGENAGAPLTAHVQVDAPPAAVVNVTQTVKVEQPAEPVPAPAVSTITIPGIFAVPLVRPPVAGPPPQPVYWGWGGQRRPDSWQPSAPAPKTPAKPDCAKPAGGCFVPYNRS
jgi:hypothetical protein